MPISAADRNLLFGVLALEMDFISREQLVAAMSSWVLEKNRLFSEILREQGMLDESTCALLETLVQKHLAMHGNDAEKSLATFDVTKSLCDELQQLADGELDRTLDCVHSGQEAWPAATTTFHEPQADARGGRFRLLRRHAKGGLGQVWVAMDEELQREVALKELLQGRSEDASCRARLVYEARITGSLEHPGIVPVYGFGLDRSGEPFYAMRFIRGKSLKEAIAEFHGSADRPPDYRSLAFRKLLGRFVDVCNAIQYAHSRHVLHRDLKPGNVMLGEYGETLVVDWGLAKALDQRLDATADGPALGDVHAPSTELTQMGQILGTLPYMSPEQAEGRPDQIGPASDIYGLGAILYCVLVNRAAFTDPTNLAILEKVRRGNFPGPRAVQSRVPRALESVCLRAMAFAPGDRYSTAAALAEDIEHWLADEPVSSHQEAALERVSRWTRRHRTWTQAGAAALLLIAVISTVAFWLVNLARQEAVALAIRNESLAVSEKQARQDALAKFRDARGTVDKWLTDASEVLRYYPGVQEVRRRMLQKAAEDYERFSRQQSDDPELELERGRTYLLLGDVRMVLGEPVAAEKSYSAAIALFSALAQTHPDLRECPLKLAQGRTKLGLALASRGQHAEAERAYASAISQLQALARESEREPRLREALGSALLNQGELWITVGRKGEAKEALRRSAEELQIAVQADAGEPRYQAALCTARNAMGQMLADEGRHDEAMAHFQQALSTLETLVAKHAAKPQYLESRAGVCIALASIYRALGRDREERAVYRQAVANYQALLKALPDVPAYRESLAMTWTDLGQLLQEQGCAAQAEAELSRALAIFVTLSAEHPQIPRYREDAAACRDTLGQALMDSGRNKEAEAALRSACEACQQLALAFPDVPQYRQRLAVTQIHCGQSLQKLGQAQAARETYLRAIPILEGLVRTSPRTPSHRNELGYGYAHLASLIESSGDKGEATKTFRRAKEVWEELVAQTPAAEYVYNLARLLVDCPIPELRDPKRAIEMVDRAQRTQPKSAASFSLLGAALYRAGDWQASVAALEAAINHREGGHARDWFFLAMARARSGQVQEALKNFDSARHWMEKNCPDRVELKRLRDEAASLLKSSSAKSPRKS